MNQVMNCRRLVGLSYSRMKWFCRYTSQQEVLIPTGCCQQGEENLTKRDRDFGKTLLDTSSTIQLDMDLGSRLSDPMELQQNMRLRGMQQVNIHRLAREYMQFKMVDMEKKEIEEERCSIVQEMEAMVKSGHKRNDPVFDALKERGREIRKIYKEVEGKANSLCQRLALTALQLPNILSTDTPEKDHKILKENVATDISEDHHLRISHIDAAFQENLIKVSNIGDRAFYFQGSLAMLEQTLLNDFSERLTNSGFIPMACPEIFRDNVLEASGMNLDDNYKLNRTKDNVNMDHYIRGNSLSSFSAFLSKILTETDALPLKFFSSGRSYKPGPADNDQHPGLFSSTQSVKTSALVMCESAQCAQKHYHEGQTLLWELYMDYLSKYQISARLSVVPACELERLEQSRTDLQLWLPSISQYVTVAYVSMIGDYISRRLTIRHSKDLNDARSSYPVHMVYSEVLNVNKLIAVLLEHGLD